MVPVENSTEGTISRTLDLLLTKDLKICGEIILPVHHFCLSKNNNLKKIKTIYAHGQSLAQCHDWLMSNLPDIKKIIVCNSTKEVEKENKFKLLIKQLETIKKILEEKNLELRNSINSSTISNND